MPVPVFLARVDASARLVLPPSEKGRRRAWLITLANQDVELVVRKRRKQRTHRQLRYWFGVPMTLLGGHTGYTKLQMHYLCIAICFGVLVDPATGREVPLVPASRHLTTAQFAQLVDWCPAWALETFQIEIPLPDEIDIDSLPGGPEAEVDL